MKKILLIDYISYTDNCGNPIGHPLKIMREYGTWMEKYFDVTYVAHEYYLNALGVSCSYPLKYNITSTQDYTSLLGRLKQLYYSFSNLKSAYSMEQDYYWMQNIDIFLFFFLFVHPRYIKKTIVTMYSDGFEKKYHNIIFNIIARRLKLLICSSKTNKYSGINKVLIPDYLYDKENYSKYRNVEKKKQAVCLGIMSSDKNIEGIIELFSKIEYRLIIIGFFNDLERFEKIKIGAPKNVLIDNRYVEYEEYLHLLSESRFSVLPYRYDVYCGKTSGVVLESIFMHCVPVVDSKLLEKWGIRGLNFDEFERKYDNDNVVYEIVNDNERIIEKDYSKDVFVELLKNVLMN